MRARRRPLFLREQKQHTMNAVRNNSANNTLQSQGRDMNTPLQGWQLALSVALLFGLSNIAPADAVLEKRIAKYKPICSDYESAKKIAECHRPPGSYQAAYQMAGERRKRALEQGRKAIKMSRDTDRHMQNKYRYR